MKMTKTMIRFFTLTDFEKEEAFLRVQHQNGWKLKNTVLPCFYHFERCAPMDMVYKLDFRDKNYSDDYYQMFRDYGWEYLFYKCGWDYFCKSADTADDNTEIFSDMASKLNMLRRIMKRRFIPFLVIFLCCVIPNFVRFTEENSLVGGAADFFTWFWTIMLVLYTVLTLKMAWGFRQLKQKYESETH